MSERGPSFFRCRKCAGLVRRLVTRRIGFVFSTFFAITSPSPVLRLSRL